MHHTHSSLITFHPSCNACIMQRAHDYAQPSEQHEDARPGKRGPYRKKARWELDKQAKARERKGRLTAGRECETVEMQ